MHGSLVTSSLLAETLGSNSFNAGYIFGQEDYYEYNEGRDLYLKAYST